MGAIQSRSISSKDLDLPPIETATTSRPSSLTDASDSATIAAPSNGRAQDGAPEDPKKAFALRPCGCHRVFPPPSTSAPFNDTPRNRAAIKACLDALDSWPNTSESCIHGYGPGMVVLPPRSDIAIKIVDDYGFAEASTMRWVGAHTSIPVPKVLAALKVNGRKYIVMERPRGAPLSDKWEVRSRQYKKRIYEQLAAMVEQMRAVPCPSGVRFESVDGGPLNSREISTDLQETAPGTYGPCPTISVLHHQLFRDMLHKEPYSSSALDAEEAANPTPNVLPQSLEKMVPYDDDTCPLPVFSHGDLTFLNVWVDGNKITSILGWQGAGWWPDYWEYTQAKLCWWGFKDWRDDFPAYLTPYPKGLELMSLRARNAAGC